MGLIRLPRATLVLGLAFVTRMDVRAQRARQRHDESTLAQPGEPRNTAWEACLLSRFASGTAAGPHGRAAST